MVCGGQGEWLHYEANIISGRNNGCVRKRTLIIGGTKMPALNFQEGKAEVGRGLKGGGCMRCRIFHSQINRGLWGVEYAAASTSNTKGGKRNEKRVELSEDGRVLII